VREPSYYVAVFGKPGLPDKDTVDSGRYLLGVRGTDTPGERGDIEQKGYRGLSVYSNDLLA
jgi:hypothetical protein